MPFKMYQPHRKLAPTPPSLPAKGATPLENENFLTIRNRATPSP